MLGYLEEDVLLEPLAPLGLALAAALEGHDVLSVESVTELISVDAI